ncbi:MAG: hypothetical protein ACLFV4_12185 [Candidatus Hydrogenedentota bacterium]
MSPTVDIVGLVAVGGFYAIVLIGLIGGLVLAALRIIRGGSRRAEDDEEAVTIQELHAGLARMEQRVEALETILLERERKGERQ